MSSAYISTKFLSPTNNRGSRIKASCQCGSIIVPWDYSLNCDQNHISAMKTLIEKTGIKWGDEWSIGSNNVGYVFVPIADFNTFII